MQRCKKCGREQEDIEFEGRHPSRCKTCWRKYDKFWHAKMLERHGADYYKKIRKEVHKRRLKKFGRKGLNEMAKANYHLRKSKIFDMYGGKSCAHCGTVDTRVLVIDHINNDGNQHRLKHLGSKTHAGVHTYNWIIRNKYPPGFQVLCHNCNWIKRLDGQRMPTRNIDIYKNDLEYNALQYAKEA